MKLKAYIGAYDATHHNSDVQTNDVRLERKLWS